MLYILLKKRLQGYFLGGKCGGNFISNDFTMIMHTKTHISCYNLLPFVIQSHHSGNPARRSAFVIESATNSTARGKIEPRPFAWSNNERFLFFGISSHVSWLACGWYRHGKGKVSARGSVAAERQVVESTSRGRLCGATLSLARHHIRNGFKTFFLLLFLYILHQIPPPSWSRFAPGFIAVLWKFSLSVVPWKFCTSVWKNRVAVREYGKSKETSGISRAHFLSSLWTISRNPWLACTRCSLGISSWTISEPRYSANSLLAWNSSTIPCTLRGLRHSLSFSPCTFGSSPLEIGTRVLGSSAQSLAVTAWFQVNPVLLLWIRILERSVEGEIYQFELLLTILQQSFVFLQQTFSLPFSVSASLTTPAFELVFLPKIALICEFTRGAVNCVRYLLTPSCSRGVYACVCMRVWHISSTRAIWQLRVRREPVYPLAPCIGG